MGQIKRSDVQKLHSQAKKGAYSKITRTEALHDRSVTVDKNEQNIFSKNIKLKNLPRSGMKLAGPKHQKFYVWDIKTQKETLIELNLKYPKSEKSEIRLYFKEKKFAPSENDTWFTFVCDSDKTYIGFCNTVTFNEILGYEPHLVHDEDDGDYQKKILEVKKGETSLQKTPRKKRGRGKPINGKFPRDATRANSYKEQANYECELQSRQKCKKSFTTDKNQLYAEIHHFIPMAESNKFVNTLDVEANMFCLCANCHREIHYGKWEKKKDLLSFMFSEKSVELKKAGISVKKKAVYEMYDIPIISD